MLPPLSFRGVGLPRPWGGDRIRTVLGKPVEEGKAVGEWWEVYDREGHSSVVAEGPLAGKTLAELAREQPEAILGRNGEGRFPLMVRWIDARERTPIIVHPDEKLVAALPKRVEVVTKIWYFLRCDPEAAMLIGVKNPGWPPPPGALEGPDAVSRFEPARVRAGDVCRMEAGTAHALLAGSLLLQIQPNAEVALVLNDPAPPGGAPAVRPDLAVKAVRAGRRAEPRAAEAVMTERGKAPLPERSGVIDRGPPIEAVLLQSMRPFEPPPHLWRPSVLCFVEGEGELRHKDGSTPFRAGSVFVIPAVPRPCTVHPKGTARAVWAARAIG